MSRLPANLSRFTFEIVGLAEEFSVLSFSGSAAISALYEYDVTILCESDDLDLDQMLGNSAVLTLIHPDHPRVIHGMVCMGEQQDVGDGFSCYKVRLVPKLWWLQHRSGHRIFQNSSIPDIVKKVLNEASIQGRDLMVDLKSDYAPRDYCTQYGETELAFIQRLLDDEGIAYYFRHDVDGHTMVLTDHNGTYEPIVGEKDIRFCQEERTAKDESIIYALHPQQQITVNSANVSDYNFSKPNQRLHSDYSKPTQEKIGKLEDYRYRSQFSEVKQDASRYQTINKLQALCFKDTALIVSDEVRLTVGCRYSVKEHPNASLNREYLLYQYQIKGSQPQSKEAYADASACRYECVASSVPANVVFKSKSQFAKPKIKGVQTAFVTGPGSNEIYTDSQGRIKVQFHWDREGQYNEKASCWIRVSQALAGKEWGSWMLPRVGQEVIVSFEEGDPDRPLVTGAVYNAISKPPYPLPKYKSRSGIKTRSTEKGSGFNEVRIEDQKDKEQIYIRAEKNADLRIKNDRKTFVGRDQHTAVSKSSFVDVGSELHETVAKNQQLEVGQNLSFSVGKDFNLKVSGADVKQVGNQLHIKGGMKTTLQAGTQLSLVAGGSFITLDPSGVSIMGPVVRINEGGSASSAKGASPTAPEAPVLPDDDNVGKLEKVPPTESPYKQSKLTFAEGKAQKVTLKMAARARAALVDYCPECELQPLAIADVVRGENQVDVLHWGAESKKTESLNPYDQARIEEYLRWADGVDKDDPMFMYAQQIDYLAKRKPSTLVEHMDAMDGIQQSYDDTMASFAEKSAPSLRADKSRKLGAASARDEALREEYDRITTLDSGALTTVTPILDLAGLGIGKGMMAVAKKAASLAAAKMGGAKVTLDAVESQAKNRALQLEALDGGHSVARHGPEISDADLLKRLETGIAPDGKFSPTPASTKFNSYKNWEESRANALSVISQRNSVDLSKAPGPNDPLRYSEVVDHGRPIDDGFVGVKPSAVKIGNIETKKVAKVYPDHEPVSGITRTTTTIVWNQDKKSWDVVQHFPSAKNWNQSTKSYDD